MVLYPSQEQLKNSLDFLTSSKIFELQLDLYQVPDIRYSPTGRELLLTSSSGYHSLIRWKDFELLHELQIPNSIISSTFLSKGFYAMSLADHILINDFQGKEVHALENKSYFKDVNFLSYSDKHYLMTSCNDRGEIVYFDTSIGKEAFNLKISKSPSRTIQKEILGCLDGVLCIGNCNGNVFKANDIYNNIKSFNKTQNQNFEATDQKKKKQKFGRSDGYISLFSPKSKNALATINSSDNGFIRSLCLDHSKLGRGSLNKFESILVSVNSYNEMSFWDIRNYFKPLKEIKLNKFAKKENLKIGSIKNLKLNNNFLCFSSSSDIFLTLLNEEICSSNEQNSNSPLNLINNFKSNSEVLNFEFCPYEPILGATYINRFQSYVHPGLEKANEHSIDSLNYNFPYSFQRLSKEGKSFKRTLEINHLIDKLDPSTIRIPFKNETLNNIKSKPIIYNFTADEMQKFEEGKKSIKILRSKIDILENRLKNLNEEMENLKVKEGRSKRLATSKRMEIKRNEFKRDKIVIERKIDYLKVDLNKILKEENKLLKINEEEGGTVNEGKFTKRVKQNSIRF